MKRMLRPIAGGILVLSLFGAGTASAQPVPQFAVTCTPAAIGGSIHVQARVIHAVKGKTFVAVASAPLTGGTAAVNLRRAGKSFVAVGKIAVPSTQTAGTVPVTVTITYNGVATVVPCTSRIHTAATP
jgi:hypothetical protein